MTASARLFLFALLAMIFWGTAPILGKIGLGEASPYAGLFVRTAVVFAVIIAWGMISGNIAELGDLNSRDTWALAGEGLLASLLGHFAYFYALKHGEASLVAPMIASYPLVTVIVGVLALGESMTWPKGLGIGLITAGVVVISLYT